MRSLYSRISIIKMWMIIGVITISVHAHAADPLSKTVTLPWTTMQFDLTHLKKLRFDSSGSHRDVKAMLNYAVNTLGIKVIVMNDVAKGQTSNVLIDSFESGYLAKLSAPEKNKYMQAKEYYYRTHFSTPQKSNLAGLNASKGGTFLPPFAYSKLFVEKMKQIPNSKFYNPTIVENLRPFESEPVLLVSRKHKSKLEYIIIHEMMHALIYHSIKKHNQSYKPKLIYVSELLKFKKLNYSYYLQFKSFRMKREIIKLGAQFNKNSNTKLASRLTRKLLNYTQLLQELAELYSGEELDIEHLLYTHRLELKIDDEIDIAYFASHMVTMINDQKQIKQVISQAITLIEHFNLSSSLKRKAKIVLTKLNKMKSKLKNSYLWYQKQ